MTAGIVVLHDVGAAAAGAPWRGALSAAGWDGPVVAPDLPGHGSTPAPTGGSYELADAAIWALPALAEAVEGGDEPPVVVGVGTNGWGATIVAMAGRASALVLVDGLGGPWTDAFSVINSGREWLRAIADDPAAVAPAPANGLDPRLRHGLAPQRSQRTAERAAAATKVPVLVIQTPASALDRADRSALVAHFSSPVDVVELPTRDPSAVAAAVVKWERARFT